MNADEIKQAMGCDYNYLWSCRYPATYGQECTGPCVNCTTKLIVPEVKPEVPKSICYAIVSAADQENETIMAKVAQFKAEHTELEVTVVSLEQLHLIALKKNLDREGIVEIIKGAKFNAELILKPVEQFEPLHEFPTPDMVREKKKHERFISDRHSFKANHYKGRK
jgi:hypothetical protein